MLNLRDMPEWDRAIEFLTHEGALELDHSDSHLLNHLQETAFILERWGAAPNLCFAGLFHSVYGTERFTETVVDFGLRSKVQDVIGDAAEKIAYHFCVMDRSTLYNNLDRTGNFFILDRLSGSKIDLNLDQTKDLYNLTVANWLEQRPDVPSEYKNMHRVEYENMRPFLLPAAEGALNAAYGYTPRKKAPARWRRLINFKSN